MCQLAQHIISNYSDNTAISLIYAAKTLSEMVFLDDLVKLNSKGKVNFYPVVENVEVKNWNFGTDRITKDMIESLMPVPNGIKLLFKSR